MTMQPALSALPPVHEILQSPKGQDCTARHGHAASLACIREVLDECRQRLLAGTADTESRESAPGGLPVPRWKGSTSATRRR